MSKNAYLFILLALVTVFGVYIYVTWDAKPPVAAVVAAPPVEPPPPSRIQLVEKTRHGRDTLSLVFRDNASGQEFVLVRFFDASGVILLPSRPLPSTIQP